MAKRAKKLVPAPLPPVTPEFRAQCHELLDKTLTDHPGSESVLIVVAVDLDVHCASIPNSVVFKRGCIDTLYDALHPESNPFE